MTGFYGADTDELRQFATLMANRATAIADLRSRLEPLVHDESSWTGPDAERFRADWASGPGTQVITQAEQLRAFGTDLTRQADEQDAVSAGDAGASGSGGGGSGNETPGTSLWDRVISAETGIVDFYNRVQGTLMRSKKLWDLSGIVRRSTPAIKAAEDPLLRLLGYDEYGYQIAGKVFTKPDKAYSRLSEVVARRIPLPTGFWTHSAFRWVDNLAAKSPFLTKMAPYLGKAMPEVSIVLETGQAIDGFRSGDTFRGVTGTVGAVGGGLLLAGGVLSATGVGAVVGGPLAVAGSVLSVGSAAADLGREAYEHWDTISSTASDAWHGTTDAVSSATHTAVDTAQDVGHHISGAWHSVFG